MGVAPPMQGIGFLINDYGIKIDCNIIYSCMCSVGLPAGDPVGVKATLSSAVMPTSSLTQVIVFLN